MTPRLLPAAALAATVLAVPAAASAATVSTSRGCYPDNGAKTAAVLNATGFAANAPVQATVDGKVIGTAQTDAVGALTTSFPVPALGSAFEAEHDVTLTDGTTSASARFSTTQVTASLTPSSGALSTWKASFSVYGMNLVQPKQKVYVHYVAPGGKVAKRITIGTAKGDCGHIVRTKARKLFNFKAKSGTWTLQFGTSKSYKRCSSKSTSPCVTYKVKVRRVFV